MKGIITIGLYWPKTQRMIKRPGCCHGFKGVKTHPFVAACAGLLNDSLCQHPPDFSVTMAGDNIKPFHFADQVFQRTQGHAPGNRFSCFSQKNTAFGRRVFSGQRRQLPAESLKFEIHTQRRRILLKQSASLPIMIFGLRLDDAGHRRFVAIK